MAPELSVTRLIGMLKGGDREAAQRLWEAYFGASSLARARLRGVPTLRRRRGGRGAQRLRQLLPPRRGGPLPPAGGPRRPLAAPVRHHRAQGPEPGAHERRAARGRGRVLSLSDLAAPEVDRLLGAGPTPELAAQMTEECRRLLDALGDETLRSVALWKMEGYTDAEIAGRLGCIRQTVGRKLKLIRDLWSEEGPP